jgi:hypothetical protein
MARSTFEGPILSGDNRFGPLRNVGYTMLAQHVDINLATTTPNTAGYGGSSGVFVNGNGIPNASATVYQPSSSVFPSVVQTIPADTATNVYRGVVCYLPAGCDFDGVNIDCQTVVAVAGGTAALTSATVYVSNNYTAAAGTPTYFSTGAISAVGRQALSTFTATQITNQSTTSTDILQSNGQPSLSQVVITLAIVGTALNTRTSLTGAFSFFVRYIQKDGNIGTATAYPFGNLD